MKSTAQTQELERSEATASLIEYLTVLSMPNTMGERVIKQEGRGKACGTIADKRAALGVPSVAKVEIRSINSQQDLVVRTFVMNALISTENTLKIWKMHPSQWRKLARSVAYVRLVFLQAITTATIVVLNSHRKRETLVAGFQPI
jgi:hypothetical protein